MTVVRAVATRKMKTEDATLHRMISHVDNVIDLYGKHYIKADHALDLVIAAIVEYIEVATSAGGSH